MLNSRIKYPNGWEIIERKLRDIQAKMRKVENDPYDGKRKPEALWHGFSSAHLKSRFIYDLYYRRKQISRELYEFCLDHGYADRYIIAKWKESRPPKSQNEVLNIPTICKKQSVYWQSRQPGNSRQKSLLQGIEAEREIEIETKRKKKNRILRMEKEDRVAQEENKQNICGDHLQKSKEAAKQGVKEAIKSASEKLELAVKKRQQAQTLMEYADLATKWATLALKIAEATRSSGSPDLAASSYLDDKFK